MQETKRKSRASACVLALGLAVTWGCSHPSWEDAMAAGQQATAQGRYGDAERIFSAAVVKAEQFGSEDRRVARALSGLAQAYAAQNKHAEAEPIYLRALKIYQTVHGETHPEVALTLKNLAQLYASQGQFTKAEPLMRRIVAIREKAQGPAHQDVANSLDEQAMLLRQMGREKEAAPLEIRAQGIRTAASSPD